MMDWLLAEIPAAIFLVFVFLSPVCELQIGFFIYDFFVLSENYYSYNKKS